MKSEDIRPVVVIDTREQAPLPFRNLPTITDGLQTGDYSVVGLEHLIAVERKSVADLVGCVTRERERFERELHRLRGYRFRRLLVVGVEAEVSQHRYRSCASPKSVLNSLAAWECRFDIPVCWAAEPEQAALLVERWCWWFARETMKDAAALSGAA